MSERDDVNYAAFAKCGCLVAIASDESPMCGRNVKKWIDLGMRVEQMSTEEFRKRPFGHRAPCPLAKVLDQSK